jgi:hypothetical protein
MKRFGTVAEWDADFYQQTGNLFPSKFGPDIIAKDIHAAYLIIWCMRYQVMDLQTLTDSVSAAELIGTGIWPTEFDPILN